MPTWKVLPPGGLGGRLLQWITDYLSNTKARVRLEGAVSSYHSLENGTPQDGVISPTLFNVLMAELLATPLPTGYHLISYADDVALMVKGKGAKFRKAQKGLDDISEKCNELGLKISPPKTKAMCFGGKMPLANKLLLQGHERKSSHVPWCMNKLQTVI
ncbi:uncharacterized protein LOC143039295 [Oratosquilla oratoria]|uniref:uncharacterized protein LOC143039295 n=1 Tax=Oratosquilla oratoria TaxID=337810 RepID=UPI003F76E3AF